MKKQILLPLIIFSCFVGAGIGSVADTSGLQANFFKNLWNQIVDTPENEGASHYKNLFERYQLEKETEEDFFDLYQAVQRDYKILLGESGEDAFVPGIILTSDRDTYDQIEEMKRSLSMIKLGVDSIQEEEASPIIRTTETDSVWATTGSGGEEKKTDMLREMDEILRLGTEICQRQRSDIKCE